MRYKCIVNYWEDCHHFKYVLPDCLRETVQDPAPGGLPEDKDQVAKMKVQELDLELSRAVASLGDASYASSAWGLDLGSAIRRSRSMWPRRPVPRKSRPRKAASLCTGRL